MGFIIVLFIFYAIACYTSFQTYKEFKALMQEQMGVSDPLGSGPFGNNPINYGSLRKYFYGFNKRYSKLEQQKWNRNIRISLHNISIA